MKTLFYLLLPMFVIIALLFSFQNRTFDFMSMLSIFSNWSFDNGYQLLLDVQYTFSRVSESFNSINSSNDFLSTISALGSIFVNFLLGLGQLLGVFAAYLVDLVTNVGNVLSYLLGINY